MRIKTDQIKYTAKLARIDLTHAQASVLSRHLNSILEYIEKLNELDTSKVEPLSHALDMFNVLRDDNVKKSLSVEDALKNAPSVKNGFFEVPKVIE
ncbi:MAG: Asp-tRNA(Asn)/Glu-tRNA(Gln) amidotransferase subunit GatC [Candidatus Omnitrophota bacterium]